MLAYRGKRRRAGIRRACYRCFSGDSVPIRLITREAVAVYLRHMNKKGIIAFHVTNTFLSLVPVVQKIAAAHRLY